MSGNGAVTGGVIKYARDNIDTDVIIPGQYLKIHDYAELATHAMEGLDGDFHSKAKNASFIVAGRNFGCGSSREHAPIALAHSGIKAVAALSFARIFYRNAVDGAFLLPIEIGEDAYEGTGEGDVVTIDVKAGQLRNETTGKRYEIKPFSEIIGRIIDAGGLFRYGMQQKQTATNEVLGMAQNASTLFEKIWDSHEVLRKGADGPSLLYVDRHMVHEVTSPQAFEGLRANGREVRRPDLTVATMDHNVPTTPGERRLPMADQTSDLQVRTLEENCREFGIRLFGMDSPNQGIVHVIGPQLGITLPGATIVCGDSHTSTHGAFGALAFGIGTSDVEHVLASQTVWMQKPKSLEIMIRGRMSGRHAVTAKDVILYVIRKIGTDGGTGHVAEYRGQAVSDMSMEQRMTICNMSIEAGARAGLVAPDEKTFEYLRGRTYTPENYEEMATVWERTLRTDPNASFAKRYEIDASRIAPQVSWGTNPGMTCDVTEAVPDPAEYGDGDKSREDSARKALQYMGLEPGTPMTEIPLDRVFIGSCTNARLEDLIEASRAVRGRKIARGVRAMVVPGSQAVKRSAEEIGLDAIFKDAGFEWRESGCSMCLGMNPDILMPGERCASTSNRNFEGRQGTGGRTHLASPVMAAAAAVNGHFVDVREMDMPNGTV